LKVTKPSHYLRCMRIGHLLIDRERLVPWPSRSLHLNPLDFFFWNYSKNIVYENASTTRLDMINRIKRVCEEITPEILRSKLENF